MGGLIGLLGLCFLIFFVLFVYPRPSRLPDPLLAVQGVQRAGGPQRTESLRLIDPATVISFTPDTRRR